MDEKPGTILAATKTYWPRFAALWCVPLVNLAGVRILADSSLQLWFFWLVSTPLFFWAFFRAAGVWTERRIRYTHFAVLAFLVPPAILVAIAGFAVLLRMGLGG